MSRTDILLLAVAAYVAVITLVRMMKSRRDALVADVQRQVDARRKRGRTAEEGAAKKRDAA